MQFGVDLWFFIMNLGGPDLLLSAQVVRTGVVYLAGKGAHTREGVSSPVVLRGNSQ